MDSIPILGSQSVRRTLDVEDLLFKLELEEKIALLSAEQLTWECHVLCEFRD